MSIVNGPKCRLCRRQGEKLFLKGSKCFSEKCAISKRKQAPGQHGNAKRRPSDYSKQLREKQKAKRIYGLTEKQFRIYYEKAAKKAGITGEALLQIIESRLDNVILNAGFALSRRQARQNIRQGRFMVNKVVVTIPSYVVSVDDIVSVNNEKGVMFNSGAELPEWIKIEKDKKSAKIVRFPVRDDIKSNINEQLIVEFYSR